MNEGAAIPKGVEGDKKIQEAMKDLQLNNVSFDKLTKDVLNRQFRKLSGIYHPNKGGDPKIFVKMESSKKLLEDTIKKREEGVIAAVDAAANVIEDGQPPEQEGLPEPERLPLDEDSILAKRAKNDEVASLEQKLQATLDTIARTKSRLQTMKNKSKNNSKLKNMNQSLNTFKSNVNSLKNTLNKNKKKNNNNNQKGTRKNASKSIENIENKLRTMEQTIIESGKQTEFDTISKEISDLFLKINKSKKIPRANNAHMKLMADLSGLSNNKRNGQQNLGVDMDENITRAKDILMKMQAIYGALPQIPIAYVNLQKDLPEESKHGEDGITPTEIVAPAAAASAASTTPTPNNVRKLIGNRTFKKRIPGVVSTPRNIIARSAKKRNNNVRNASATLSAVAAAATPNELKKKDEIIQQKDKTLQQKEELIKQKNRNLQSVQQQLEEARRLLENNKKAVVPQEVDYTDCQQTVDKFKQIQAIFARKTEVINTLDKIIHEPEESSPFAKLSQAVKDKVASQFETVKTGLNIHMEKMKLDTYVNDPLITSLKNKSKQKKNSAALSAFCDTLQEPLAYWNEHETEFREQDNTLTNIYEDISGAVRVYIKIKPIGGDAFRTVQPVDKTKNVRVDCSNVPSVAKEQTFGAFYGVFDQDFTNKDTYTGIKGFGGDASQLVVEIDSIEETPDTTHPGLYSTFKQVEDGYSIVLFGYGLSGSGKTYTLIGDQQKNVPGLLHYGLANLEGVQKMEVAYIFEMYNKKFTPTIPNISGQILTLVGDPTFENPGILISSENPVFKTYIEKEDMLTDFKPEYINTLTGAIEKYRIQKNRIKKTPNNPVSSRSHLFLVFKITFTTGKVGYVTIVDTAGRESPLGIKNIFINDKSSTGKDIPLLSLLDEKSGPTTIETNLRPDIKALTIDETIKDRKGKDVVVKTPIYTGKNVYEILHEGFYINETINHLIYYFNKKNGKTMTIGPAMKQKAGLKDYSDDKYFVDPVVEDGKGKEIDKNKNCLMIPVLNFLDTISKSGAEYKPTKFITMVCVRQDQPYCGQIFGSLEFAQKIKST